ncbi:MAG: tetratricopeptide repeat protein [Stellaceae bacterium]
MQTVETAGAPPRHQATDQPGAAASIEAQFEQGVSLHVQGKLDQAEQLYRAVLQADGTHIGSLQNLGILCFQRGQYDDTIALTREVVRLRPDLSVAHNTLAVAQRHLGRLEEAESCCREALRLAPEYAEAHNTLGDVLTALHRSKEAEACCREALRLRPEYAEAYNNLGAALTALGRLDEAEICCREALRRKPGNAAALNNLGTVLTALGRLDEAEICCREALRLMPGNAAALNNLGAVLTALGRLDEAEICCREALRLVQKHEKYLFSRYLKNIFGDRYKLPRLGALPPAELVTTEALMHKDDLKLRARAEYYFSSGFRDARTVLRLLETWTFDLRSMQSVLEFGCGSGRVLRHFRNITGLRLAGTDANPKPIAWDRINLPGIDFSENALIPPLKYDDASFDLVYALSVFTHIPLDIQLPWLNELRRILRPGGYLLCTVLGKNFVNSMLNEQDRARLERDGALTLDRSHPGASYSTQVLGSWDVFQTREQVRAAFGAGFEILCYTATPAAAGQDTLVLRAALN